MKNVKSLLLIASLAVFVSLFLFSMYFYKKHGVLIQSVLFPKGECGSNEDCHIVSCGPGMLLRCVQQWEVERLGDDMYLPREYYPIGCGQVPGVMDVSKVGCYCNKGMCSMSPPIRMNGVD